MEVKEPVAGRRGATALAITVAWAAILILVLFSLSRGAVPAAAGTGQPGSKLHHTAVIPLPVVLSGASASSGGEFVYAVGSDVAGLDPSGTTDGTSFLVTRQIYETLVANEPGGTLPRPGLAESWIVSSDGLTWTFRLRPGVKFHDGTPLDAAAVVYNFQRWWDPAHPFHDGPFEYFGFMFYGFKGDPGCLLGNVLAVGTDQVQLVLTRPYSPLPSTLAMPPFAIASPAAIQAGTLDAAPVGSGPFQFVAWLPGDEVRLEAYVGYWGLGPYLQSLVFRVIPDAGDRLAALQAGAVQGADNMPWSSVPLAAADLNLRVSWRPALNTGYLGINRAHPPLDNPLVRQAIAHALDKAAIVSSHYNQDAPGGQVATQLLPPAQWGRDEALVDYDYDPSEAEALLADAGYGGGLHTTLWVLPVTRLYLPNALDLALSMQEDLNSVGISTTLITEYDWATYLTKVADGEADLFMLGWGGDNGHPDNFFYPLLCDQYQRYGPRDDALCAALDSARVEEDLTMQLATYEWSSRRVHETLPLVPIGHSRTALFFRENVGGFVPGPLASESFGPVFLASDWVEVVADTAATLVYTDAQGSETVVEVPAGATVDPITLLYAPLDGAADVAAGFYAGHGFVLEAYSSGELLSDLAFEVPIVVTLYYTDADVAGVDEETLALRYWDGLAWSSDGITVVERDTAGNRLVVTLAHLSEFRLLARGEHEAHLPVVLRALP